MRSSRWPSKAMRTGADEPCQRPMAASTWMSSKDAARVAAMRVVWTAVPVVTAVPSHGSPSCLRGL